MGGRNRGRKGKKKQNRDENPRQSTHEIVAKGNVRFESYYAVQGIHNEHWISTTTTTSKQQKLVACQTDEERNNERLRWVSALKQSLPASFRIGKDLPLYFQKALAKELEEFIQTAVSYQPTEDDVQADKRGRSTEDFEALADTTCTKLAFLQHAYQLSLDRVALRRNPALKQLQNWLTSHAEQGHITRQETVSMIPPVLLDVCADDRVLDMCAAPGSKTTQMLETMSVTARADSMGCLVANDSNTHRAYMLAHQLRRIHYHHPVALITAIHAQNFPNTITFDKILCDVPCSGDGTSRKNIDVWLKWTNTGALGLHALQLQIAKRGIDLLKVNGTMCYSTCSQNPMENEAVVAELLRMGGLELVERKVEGFVTRPGRNKWKVLYDGRIPKGEAGKEEEETASTKETTKDEAAPSEEGTAETKTETEEANDTTADHPVFEPTSWKEEDLLAQAKAANLVEFKTYDDVPETLYKKIRKSVFPPTEEEASSMHLERCIRCLPQDNNTGGFFTAILRKVAPISRRDRRGEQQEPEAKRQKVEETKEADGENEEDADNDIVEEVAAKPDGNGRRNRFAGGKDNFIKATDEIMDPIVEFYGLENGFEKRLLHYRALGEMKTLYYVSPQVMELFDQGLQDRITIINTGLKAFAKNAKRADYVHGDYRICQEAIHFLAKYMTKRKISVPLADFKICLNGIAEKAMKMEVLSESTQEKLKDMEAGSYVMMAEGHDDLMACMWRNKAPTVNCLVGKIDLSGMRQKIESLEESTRSEKT